MLCAVGVCKTNSDGTFVLQVEPSKFYQLFVEYGGRKVDKAISGTDAMGKIQIDVGRFDVGRFE